MIEILVFDGVKSQADTIIGNRIVSSLELVPMQSPLEVSLDGRMLAPILVFSSNLFSI